MEWLSKQHGRFPGRIEASDVLWLSLAIILCLGVRLAFINLPMIHDEGGYALAARGWFEGKGHLYEDLWISRPQGIFVVYGFTMKTIGYGAAAFRATGMLFAALTVLAVWFFARRWSTPHTAALAAIICAIMIGWPTLEGYTANAELFAGMPSAFAAFWLLRQSQTRWTVPGLIGIGMLIGVSTTLKPSGVTLMFGAAAFLLAYSHDAWMPKLQRISWVILGVCIIGGITLLHGATLGWSDFWYATVTFRFSMQSAISVGLTHNLLAIGGMLVNATEFFLLVLLVWAFRLRLPLLHLRWWSSPPGSRFVLSNRPAWLEAGDIMLVWWIVSAGIGVTMGGDYWTHYLIQLVPPVSLWLARAIIGVLAALQGWRKHLAATIFALLLILPYGVVIDGTEAIYERLYRHPGYPAQAEVARYIREHTAPDQTIYVAFDQASIYYLADRKPAYRHMYDQELRALPDSYADIIGIISSDQRPVYIISTVHPGPFPDQSRTFWREVSKYYDLETMIDGVPIYRVKPGLRHSGDTPSTNARWDLQALAVPAHPAVSCSHQ